MPEITSYEKQLAARSPKRNQIILFLTGAALSIAQFIMIRDFVTVLYGEEVTIVLVTAAFFVGLSAGYVLSLRLSIRIFEYLFILSVFLHLSFPLSYRYLAAWFASLNVSGYIYITLLFLYALLFTAVFAAVLPRLLTIEDPAGTSMEERLKNYYSVELFGFIAGFFFIFLSWNKPLIYLLPFYWLIQAILLYLVVNRIGLNIAHGAAILVAAIFLYQADYHSTALLYKYKHGQTEPVILYSVNSPYQKVEVIETSIETTKGGRELGLYLNGLLNLNSTDLEALNYYIAQLPAALSRPRKTLLVGNGTLSSVPKVYPFSQKVISVELDPSVLEAGRRFFVDPQQLIGLDRWELNVDDGKHYLNKSTDKFDLIIMDVPSPLTIQVAMLHTVEFYRLAKEHLSETGIISVQLSGPLQRNNRSPARITAALRKVFKDVMVISSEKADRDFAYASMKLPISAVDVQKYAQSYETSGLKVIEPKDVDTYLEEAIPLAIDNLDLVLRRGWERFADRYFEK